MATADNDPISLECKICEKNYQYKDGPLLLPCLHSFCKPCLSQYIKKGESPDDKMACPTCNSRFPIPDGINTFPLNLRLSHLAKNNLYKDKMDGGSVPCQKCEEDDVKNATVFCCNCCEFLCKRCKHYHQRFLSDDDHAFIELAKYDKSDFKIHPPPPKCPSHRKQELTFFCEDCEVLICRDCAQITHKDCKQNYLDKMSEKENEVLVEMAENVGSALGTLDHALQEIQDMREKVAISAKDASNKINQVFKELIQAVEARREDLQIKCKNIAQEKEDVLSNQFNEFERLRSDLHYAQLHANDASHNHTPEEVLSVKKTIKQRINQLMGLYERQSMELREDDTINTSVEIQSLLEQIQGLGFFPGVPDPSKCTVEGFAVPIAGVGKERKMAVVLKDEKNEPLAGHVYLQCQVLRKVNEGTNEQIPLQVTITQSNEDNGLATLAFTPDQPGDYEVTVMVRNTSLNPHTITARPSQDYSDFSGRGVSVYKNVGGNCWGVAIHDNGTIYVSSRNTNTIKVLRSDGSEGVYADGNLSSPRGLVILDGSLYVVSSGDHTIKKYSIDDGKFVKSFGSNAGGGSGDGQFNNPYGICTDGKGRLLVADYGNRRIQILTADGRYVHSFNCSNQPHDVAVDPVGSVHVALYNCHHIAVYSQEGTKLGTYNLDGVLRYPSGIYIDGEGNRLISAQNDSKVHIADVNNKVISTRSISNVYMSTMDKNGGVFMSEYGNNTVAVLNH